MVGKQTASQANVMTDRAAVLGVQKRLDEKFRRVPWMDDETETVGELKKFVLERGSDEAQAEVMQDGVKIKC